MLYRQWKEHPSRKAGRQPGRLRRWQWKLPRSCPTTYLMATGPLRVICVAALEIKQCLFVALLVQIVEERRVAVLGELMSEFVETRKDRDEIRLGTGRFHRF